MDLSRIVSDILIAAGQHSRIIAAKGRGGGRHAPEEDILSDIRRRTSGRGLGVQPAVSNRGGCCAFPRMRSGVFEWPEEDRQDEVKIRNVV